MLNANVHATLSDIADLRVNNIDKFDILICNLYKFQDSVESIDVGGHAMLRAAAKNYERVTVLSDPKDYHYIGEKTDLSIRKELARKAFLETINHDKDVFSWLCGETNTIDAIKRTSISEEIALSYGENPHQNAHFLKYNGYIQSQEHTEHAIIKNSAEDIVQMNISYNNMLDYNGGIRAVYQFQCPTIAVALVKHGLPCALACSENNIVEAFNMAYECDQKSAFGGIFCTNSIVTLYLLKAVADRKLFLQLYCAPKFDTDAIAYLKKKKKKYIVVNDTNVRKALDTERSSVSEARAILGGILYQNPDTISKPEITKWKCVTERKVPDDLMKYMHFAWKSLLSVKSNGIVLCSSKRKRTLAIGSGQPNRVASIEIAKNNMKER